MSKKAFAALALIAVPLLQVFVACSNSEYMETTGSGGGTNGLVFDEQIIDKPDANTEYMEIIGNGGNGKAETSLKDYLLLDDAACPYTGVPRIVIETEKHRAIKDRETEIPAKLQIWDEKKPNSDIMELTIRGRGNSSWTVMPKKSYKVELKQGAKLLGMPKDKDWALIANYADKTLMKNYLAYRLADDIGMDYSPRCKFVDFCLNGEYQGVYLLTETIKVDKNRVNIPKNDKSYLVEFDEKYKADEQVIFSDVLVPSKPFQIHFPKNASDSVLNVLATHVQRFEKFLKTVDTASLREIESWIDVEAFAKHFWIQEFLKNPDANYLTSVYFTWMENGAIKMGPVWDFDIAFAGFGGYDPDFALTDGWRTKDDYWSEKLFSNKEFGLAVAEYWDDLRPSFEKSFFIIDSLYDVLKRPAEENFKKWDVLQKNEKWLFKSVDSYEEAVDYLREWIAKRMKWIDKNRF
jgi:Spore coat assembly protein